MVKDAKAARDRRLAEALRVNLKRRKAAKSKTPESKTPEGETAQAADSVGQAKTPAARPRAAEGDV